MIYNLGSISADYFYELPHLPRPGETLAATAMAAGLGGKGANQSIAAALAGAKVCHIGAIGADGAWAIHKIADFGINSDYICTADTPTAHAIVMVDTMGENQIVIYPGANQHQSLAMITKALGRARPGDWLMLQNETSHQVDAAKLAFEKGMKVAYSAAPFNQDAVRAVLPYTTLLIMNEVEFSQFSAGSEPDIGNLPVEAVLITKGANGAEWRGDSVVHVDAPKVEPVDTTGAGDTFAGYVVAGLALGRSTEESLRYASAAAAIAVTRKGTADAIPTAQEVDAFLS